MQIVGSAGGGSFDNENLLIADDNGVLILGMDGQTSNIINNDLIELKNSVQNTFSTVAIAGTLVLQNREVLGLGSNIAGNFIVSDGHAAELVLDGGTLDGVGRLGDGNLTLVIAALTYVVSSSGMTFAPARRRSSLLGYWKPSMAVRWTSPALLPIKAPLPRWAAARSMCTATSPTATAAWSISAAIARLSWTTASVIGTIQFTGSHATLATRFSLTHRPRSPAPETATVLISNS